MKPIDEATTEELMYAAGDSLTPEGGVVEHVTMFVSFIGPDGEDYVVHRTVPQTRLSNLIGSVMLGLWGTPEI